MRLRELVWLSLLMACGGCNALFNGFLDPTQVGRFRDKSVTQDLRRSVSVADEPTMEIDASEPTPEDLLVQTRDYVLRPGDVIDVSVFELMVPGYPWLEMRQISWEGYITLPQVKQDVQASGKTARELEKYIEKVLQEEQILTQPEVTVLIREARNLVYNILGAVGAPRSEPLPRPNFRIRDALAQAGGINPVGGPKQPTVTMAYVFRNEEIAGPAAMTTTLPVGPAAESPEPLNFGAVSDGVGGLGEEGGHWIYSDSDREWKFIRESPSGTSKPAALPKAADKPEAGERAIRKAAPRESRSVAPASGPTARTQPVAPKGESADGWEELLSKISSQRVIAIPLEKLMDQGDPRYNVVIHDGDTIWVPPPEQGEFYIVGNVNRPGPYSLTGREVTIRQALTTAAGLSPLADPSRCELIRRIGGNMEQVIYFNLDRIFAGQEPDIILKPNDIINVGSNPLTPFLAVLRNAFRATYGFGFIYDRNFADVDSYSSRENPDSIRRARREQLRSGLF